ncbi:MAG: DUF1839 family protein [Bdellovibrio sp.]|nr:DUF1839 family protein [Methylotenera sp.]
MQLQQRLFELTPASFTPHVLHSFEQNFRETNCYADLVIELVHGLGLEPVACLGYTLAADFEGDQWTFGKPSHHDLESLYGIRIEELSLYRRLLDQIATQLQCGSVPLLEVDAFHLPDTAGIDYQTSHAKTTIAITYMDVANKTIRYFHNATFAELKDEDFDGLLMPLISAQKGYLPPYCEIVKLDFVKIRPAHELRAIAFKSAQFHLKKRPFKNPIERYGLGIEAHQQAIIAGGLPAYHAYTFVALRQLGSAHQLGAHFLRWLHADDVNLHIAATAFEQISATAKMLVLKLARVSNSGKPADFTTIFSEMSAQYEIASRHLKLALA